MTEPGFLANPAAVRWLDGIVPAWLLLTQESFEELYLRSRPPDGSVRLAIDLSAEHIDQSPIARNASILLRAASTGPGLKLTATGNLSRSVVADMADRLFWPGLDMDEIRSVCKVINETDIQPLYFVRHIIRAAGLVRRHKGFLRTTRAGRIVLEDPARRALLPMLFDITFWGISLAYYGLDRYPRWPQNHLGVVLWSLSVAANDWQSSHRLTRLCTLPPEDMLEDPIDSGSIVMEAMILRLLLWFGLLEQREQGSEQSRLLRSHEYRKTALFARFLSLDVEIEHRSEQHH